MRNLVIAGVLVILALIVITQSLYVVQETEQVVVTRFGDVRSVRISPGLYLKAPFVDTVISYDRRLLRIDAPPSQLLDRDINILEIDVYGRFRISDPRAFLQTLTTEENARSILAQRINSSLRAEVAERSREEIIGGDVELDESGEPVTDDEGNSRVRPTNSRTELLNDVIEAVQVNLAQEDPSFGVEMVDIRIKRADFPQEVAGRIFERMRSDREKISRRLRAEGEEEARTRRAAADRDVEVILAAADRDADRLRGDGEAQAISILAESLNQDPEFFSFRRSLEAYKAFLNQRTTVILSSDAPIFRFLQSPGEGSSQTTDGAVVTDPLGLK
ncbi:MAG: protease modulator HflC [Chloroflexi bacterium]|jgi:membrane protease subunit HflC|nr:MAG: protease modulator HflC [Chloroflexota bacterium]RUA30930.1 MAG: protease modulator HflC [Chloroflexota bacterium]|tara:strand:+ start:374 stop:1369 length:996 start_codon:yes stop_codon:yes gene_type:complete